jgi:hypothetical protein
LLVGSVLVALPLLVDADDPIAYALEETAGRVPIPAARWLREGAALRRHVDDDRLEAATRRDVAKTWLALLQLAEARRRLDRIRQVHVTGLRVDESNERTPSAAETVVMMLDEKIHRHVAALTRAYTAIDTAKAAEVGLDDTAAQGVDAAGETLEDVSRAIVDVRA